MVQRYTFYLNNVLFGGVVRVICGGSIHGLLQLSQFVTLLPVRHLTRERLAEEIERSSSLTRADVLAVLTALRQLAADRLSSDGAFYLPEIGYLSLQASANTTGKMTMDRLKGDYIGVRNIKFRPEKELLEEVRRKARFSRIQGTTMSAEYTEEQLRRMIDDHLSMGDGSISVRTLRLEFGLSDYKAHRWLAHFVETGFLKKLGGKRTPVYVRA